MATFREQFAPAAVVAIFALAAGSACGTGGSDGEHACDAVCAGVADCGQTTCLSQCVTVEAECTVAGLTSAFQAWSSCMPNFACVGGQYQATNCARESTAVMACGTDMPGTTGHDSGPPTGRDSGAGTSRDGSTASDDGGGSVDSGTVRDTGAGVDTGPDLNTAAPETGASDTGIADASPRDASIADTSVPDAIVRDAAVLDVVVRDTTAPDARTPDASIPEASAADGGNCLADNLDACLSSCSGSYVAECELALECFMDNDCSPLGTCQSPTSICGVDTLGISSQAATQAEEVYICACE